MVKKYPLKQRLFHIGDFGSLELNAQDPENLIDKSIDTPPNCSAGNCQVEEPIHINLIFLVLSFGELAPQLQAEISDSV